jgi:macrolide-specific efflux system membrane fusion protein
LTLGPFDIDRRKGLILAVVAALASGFVVVRRLSSTATPEYLTAKAMRVLLESNVLATGTLQAIRQVDVGTRVTGQLKTLKVKLGDRVRAGDLLAEIDPALPENELLAAQARLANLDAQKRAAAATLRKSRQEFARQKGMIVGAATSRRELESAEAQAQADEAATAALDAQIAQAKAEVKIAAANLDYTKIVAPIDGEVVAVLTREGQTVVAAQIVPVILKIADLDAMTVKTQVSEADVIKVHVGQSVSFTIMGDPDRRYEGNLSAVEPAPQSYSDPSTSSLGGVGQAGASTLGAANAVFYSALFDVPNSERFLRIGMTAQVSIRLGDARKALAIPSTALRSKGAGGVGSVRVLAAGGDIETRQVRLGVDDYVQAEILEGLSENETVIIGEPDSATMARTGK